MTKYAQNGGLTRFDTGGSHSQNPNGGIDIGNNNSVEENETKQNNFVYSNRIFLDSNIVSQYNLPKSLIGKSVADATKFIDNKFKGRNDKISQSTKNGMLSKIAEAQEAMKPQEPEMEQPQEGMEQQISPEMMGDPSQMAWGGFADSTIGQGFGKGATGAQQSAAVGAGLGTLTAGLDLGMTAFGKPAQDTSGLAASAPVNSGAMIGGSALKGASAGMAFGPLGAGIGAGVGAIAGLIGSGKARKAAMENTNNYAVNVNKQFSDQYAYGGKMNQMGVGGFAEDPFDKYSKQISSKLDLQPINQVIPSFINKGTPINNAQAIIGTKVDGDFGKTQKSDSNVKLNAYRQSKGMTNIGQPLSAADYTAMGLTTDGYKINKNAFRQQIPENLNLKLDSPEEGFKKYTNIENNIEAGKDKKSIVGKGLSYLNENAGNIARYAPIAANALQLAQLKKPQGERLDRLDNRYRPEYVDEAQLQNIANQTMNNSVNAVGQSGASQGQLRSSIIGSQLQRTKALSDSYAQAAAQNRQQNAMAQEFNLGVDQVNLQQSNTEKENFARDKGNYDTQKSRLIGQIGNDIGNVGKEEIYKKIAKTTTGYSWLGEFQKMNPNATKEETIIAAKKAGVVIDDDKTAKKQALGGYLIKNKVK